MKIKNTAPGGRGFGVAGIPYEIDAGATGDIPDSVVKAARQDPSVELMFTDGTFVEVSAKAPAKAEPEVKPEADKGKSAK